ncbi:MAG: sulfurtransferase TusA family protein [Candidatus Nitrospinota bacterium M3_3B_026]
MQANTAAADFITTKPRSGELEKFRGQVAEYKSGSITGEQFKSARVNLGIYSQRQEGLFMVRTKIAAGKIPAGSIDALAEAADRWGSGFVHISTRQDFQLHNVPLDDLADVLDHLHDAGITTLGAGGNTIRNITVCRHAMAGQGPFDVAAVSRAVSGYFLGNPISKGLPRKFKITFSACAEDCGGGVIDDIGAIVLGQESGLGSDGFRLLVGGGGGSIPRLGKTLDEFVPARRVHVSILAILNIFNRMGTRTNRARARIKFLVEKLGIEKLRSLYREELASLSNVEDLAYEGSSPNGGRSGASLLLKIPVGDIYSGQLRSLGQFLLETPGVSAWNTKDGDILLTGLDSAAAGSAPGRLRALGFYPAIDKPGNVVRSCNGASLCSEGIANSKALARVLEPLAEGLDEGLGPINISVSGCPNACALHHTADIGLQGAAKRVNGRLAPHYLLYLGGAGHGPAPRLAEPVVRIPAKNVPAAVKRAVDIARSAAGDGETFGGVAARLGVEKFREELAPFTLLPSYEKNRDGYRDWESDEDFNLDEVGPGECGGSALELIEGVYNQARRDLASARQALEAGDEAAASKRAASSVSQSARALLAARGIEPGTDDELLSQFRDRIVTRGIASGRFLDALAAAAGEGLESRYGPEEWAPLGEELLEESLSAYEKLSPQGAGKPRARKKAAVERLDLSGVRCPFNYVRIKVRLEELPKGARLEAVLDDGAPVENVPRSLENDGHEILSLEVMENGQYLLLVEKN